MTLRQWLGGGGIALLLGGLVLAYWRDDAPLSAPVAPDEYNAMSDSTATVEGLPLPPLDGELY